MPRTAGRRSQVHFLHVGKTGGTAINAALKPCLTAGDYVIRLRAHSVKLRDIPVGEPVFFAVRDPLTRFVSGFNSRLRMGRPRLDRPWNRHEALVFSRFPSPDALATALSSPDDPTRLAAESAMGSLMHVSESYWKWFEDEEYFASRRSDILFVLFQERLDIDFAILAWLLGLQGRVALPRDPVQAHRTPPGFSQELSAAAEENLRRWYAREYDFLEQCRLLRGRDDL